MPSQLATAAPEEINKHLADNSYISGYTPSAADVEVFAAVKGAPDAAKLPHLARWYKHIASFTETEKSSWGGATTTTTAAPAEKKAAADDDFDLFADEDPEEEARREAAIEAKAQEQLKKKEADRLASGKEKPVLKSAVVIDVKPWEDTTDLVEMEKLVRGIAMNGLEWKASKLVPIGYGVKKLQISCHIVDELVSVDDIQEQIQGFEDHVQSTDVVTFTKL
eukprot:TRINITY_DN3213_c0_g1_i1.p1 TRINITY_DN3213_c0_g1~~TRINITY_DN3213_c0_g1_i1.p1  ORF type:complete len:222 (-),score=82.80 TRINITY_DN3213_c0_g1_i1:44-709(-)